MARDSETDVLVGLGLAPTRSRSATTARHADLQVTFRISTHVMRLRERDREGLRALIKGRDLGTNGR
jgi:hypothetical protein